MRMKVGVTGGIGSGKTTVCKVFNILGVPVFSADLIAREIMDTDPVIMQNVNRVAGIDLYAGGTLDRARLASMIFNNRTLLESINHLVHPVIFEHYNSWSEKQTFPYTIIEAAILFESGFSKLTDKVITVTAPVEERIQRVIKRDNLTMAQVNDRIRNQMDDESRIKISDYIIHNSEDEMIIPVILDIHQDILGKA